MLTIDCLIGRERIEPIANGHQGLSYWLHPRYHPLAVGLKKIDLKRPTGSLILESHFSAVKQAAKGNGDIVNNIGVVIMASLTRQKSRTEVSTFSIAYTCTHMA